MTRETVTGYFDTCDELVKLNYGLKYTWFLMYWVQKVIPDFSVSDQVVFWFEQDQLSKVDLVRDRKIIKVYSREEWLEGIVDLDSKVVSSPGKDYSDEFVKNEEKFMKYIRFSAMATPISSSTFILPIAYHDYK